MNQISKIKHIIKPRNIRSASPNVGDRWENMLAIDTITTNSYKPNPIIEEKEDWDDGYKPLRERDQELVDRLKNLLNSQRPQTC
jgi:hypothetical protein